MRRIVFSIFFLLTFAATLPAQQPRPEPRQRIGLALAGGSARGLVHVGVLRWLREHRVPVDVISGTSMGGLVGGLYAAGYEPNDIETFLRRIDWERTFRSTPPYPQLAFRRKEDAREFATTFEVGLRDGLQLPLALNPGHEVGLLLSSFTAPYTNLASFDELPTPFRCVASDLIGGKPHTFARGNLFDALRATMAIPAAFAPVPVDDMLLVDGGIFDNLPVRAAREMKAAIVIAVAIDLPPLKPDSIRSWPDTFGRSVDIVIMANEEKSKKEATLVLAPDVKDIEATEFEKMETLFQRGYEAAQKNADKLLAYALSEEKYRDYLETRRQRRRPENFTPRFVDVEGIAGGRPQDFARTLRELENEPLSGDRAAMVLTSITGSGRYDAADYRQTQREQQIGLQVRLRAKTHGPPFLVAAMNLEGSQAENIRLALGGRLTFLDFGGPYSEWRTDVLVGSTSRLDTEYYWRIGGRRVFLSARGEVEFTRSGIYDGKSRVAEYAVEREGFGMDLGYAAGRWNEFRAGYQFQRLFAAVSTGAPTLPRFEGLLGALRGQWIYDHVNSALVPTKGARALVSMKWVFSAPGVSEPYPIFETRLQAAVPLSQRYSLLASLAGGSTAGRAAAVEPFTLGGPLRMNALALDQFRGNNYYYGGITVLRAFKKKPVSFLGKNYLAFSYEVGSAFHTLRDERRFHSGSIGVLSETPLGGVLLGAAVGEHGERKLFFRIGKLF